MGCGLQIAAALWLSLILPVGSQVPEFRAYEFHFGPCHVEGVALLELWKAFGAMKDIVQAQDKIMSVRLLKQEVFQNVSDAESCYLAHELLKFYLHTVFKDYHHKIVEFKIMKSFSTLANNFFVIMSKLQPRQENETVSVRESAHRRFLLFWSAFKQLNTEAALTKAFGEVDILLTWMGKFYHH
ncbi:interleukin-24 [Dipodomys merriami]|uniref:interleukin-24 n=1 Tax=Dipodomys merriami TaxID=94247 RepID=UPI003855C753